MTQEKNLNEIKEENKVAGTVGAFLFALAGGIVYFLLWQVGYIAAISGLVAVVCAFKGYEIFAKKESTYGIVISVVMAIIVIAIAWYLCLSQDVYNAYKEWYDAGEVAFTSSYGEAVRGSYLFLAEPEIAKEYIIDLVVSIAFCALGCISPVRNKIKRSKEPANTEPQAEQVETVAENQTISGTLNGETIEKNDME